MKPRIVLRLDIAGKAEPAGSKKAFALRGKGGKPIMSRTGQPIINVVEDNEDSRDWKARVADAAAQQWGDRPLLTQPLWFRVTFYRLRNNGDFGTGKNAGNIKQSAPQFPATKPDVLKLTRAVEDALSQVIYVDDSQIVSERIDKRYGDKPHVEIEIGVLPATLHEAAAWKPVS